MNTRANSRHRRLGLWEEGIPRRKLRLMIPPEKSEKRRPQRQGVGGLLWLNLLTFYGNGGVGIRLKVVGGRQERRHAVQEGRVGI